MMGEMQREREEFGKCLTTNKKEGRVVESLGDRAREGKMALKWKSKTFLLAENPPHSSALITT